MKRMVYLLSIIFFFLINLFISRDIAIKGLENTVREKDKLLAIEKDKFNKL